MSDWKKDAAKRRDARHGGPVPFVKPRPKKDRKSWCGGKAGREHKPEPRRYNDVKDTALLSRPDWWLLVCTTCGKELERYSPMMRVRLVGGGTIEPPPPPSWVPKP